MAGDNDQISDNDASKKDDIPEVDAEIVTDETDGTADPFDEAPPDDAPPNDASSPRRSLVSPGVLFFAGLVVIAIAAGLVWHFTTARTADPVAEATDDAPAPTKEPAETPAETQDRKLANEDFSGVKPATPPPSTSSLNESVAGLATQPDAIANTDLQDAAKNASAGTDALPAAEPVNADEPAPAITFEMEETATAAETGLAEEAPEETPTPNAIVPDQNDPVTDIDDPTSNLDAVDAPAIDDGDEENPQGAATLSTEDGTAPLEAALAEERQRIAALEAAIQDGRNELMSADEALVGLRAQLETAQTEIARLRAENDALKITARQSPIAAGAVALSAIQRAVETGEPFDTELTTLKQAAPDTAPVLLLERYAAAGAPTMPAIRDAFRAAARAGLATANRENADGVVERYGARIAGLFNIRPASPQQGDGPGAVISRAEYAVDRGKLSLAIDEIRSLPPAAQEAMSGWIDLARQRAEIDASLESLNAELADRAAGPEAL